MQYGYFDDARKEYVVTRPDTPRSWSNYLGSTEYGAIITNNAGGYSFYKSGAQGRFMRMRFNSIPLDQPGRYLYLHDHDSNDYWSASWQPVGKSLDQYQSECRHGSAYTIISSEYSDITTETTYFVPLGRDFECWLSKITNKSRQPRRLSLFTYVEYANNWNAFNDLVNLQYSQFIVKMDVVDSIIDHGTNVHIAAMPDNFQQSDQGRHTFLALAGAEIKGYDTSREAFLGPYRSYHNPLAVESGVCSNSLAAGDNACGTLQTEILLAPGESREIYVLMGIGEAGREGKQILAEFNSPEKIRLELEKLKSYWHQRIGFMHFETPDPEFNSMLNMWSPFNCLITYAWSRAASLIYAGERDGLGYRDTVQDMLGVMHAIPEEARERLELMITGQVSTGGAIPVVKQFAHRPGQESLPREEEYRSDDCLWLFNAIPAYVKETGDLAFYEKILPYADKGEDTVLDHLKRAIDFNLERSGAHGLPCGLSADWNDCIRLGYRGETTFVAFQLRYALVIYIEICERLKKREEVIWAKEQLAILDDNLSRHAWDGEWFLRAYGEDGSKFGSQENEEGRIFLNPQSWAVISGHASPQRAEKAMEATHKVLATEYGLMLCAPPFAKTNWTIMRAALFNDGMKENASIFTHTQGWAVMAEALLGNGNRAYQYFKSYLPAFYNNKAEIRQIEPYVYCQFTHSKYSPHFGASRVPWLSGSATWSFYAATQYVLGIQPQYDGIKIDPCIPADWKEFKVSRTFRGRQLNIEIKNPTGVQRGIKKILLNGEPIEGCLILDSQMKGDNLVLVEMG
jgi:N,N'-diacetylchitobiose phosphorylase